MAPYIQRHPGIVKGLTGDVRTYPLDPAGAPNRSAQMIDAEWDTPGAFLVLGLAQGVRPPTWTLRTGIDRALLVANAVQTGSFFSKIVLARAISLSFIIDNAGLGSGPGFVQALAIPVELTYADAAIIGAQQGGGFATDGLGMGPAVPHGVAQVSGVPANVASVPISGSGFSGVSVQNISPAGANLYLRFGSSAASVASGGHSVRLVPNAYFETAWGPFGETDAIQGIWDAADAAGYANVTKVV